MNLYQTITENVKQYTLPVIIASTIALTAFNCKNDKTYLTANESTKEIILTKHIEQEKQLDNLIYVANTYTTTAREIFNKGLENKVLDSITMAQTLNNFKKAKETYATVRKEAKNNSIDKYADIEMSSAEKNLMMKINKTLNGIDYGKSEIEKDLKKSGLKVDVFNPTLGNETAAGVVGLLFGFATVLYLAISGETVKRPRYY
jgi:hypothetical protein